MQIICYGLCSHWISTQIKPSRTLEQRASQCSTAATSKQKIPFQKNVVQTPVRLLEQVILNLFQQLMVVT